MAARLSDAEIAQRLEGLAGWERAGAGGNAIRKSFSFGKFADGIRFVDRVAAAADGLDHHPDIDIRYTTITMTLSTHSAGGLTAKDFELAERIEQAAR
jgi:4a-hydroxytetrahydrobiopterin dehydratase